MYELTEELKEIQKLFSEAFSIPAKEKDKNFDKVPDDWNFESNTAVLVSSDKPKTVKDDTRESKPMKLFRMLVILLDFNEPNTELNGFYELSFTNFDMQQTYKLEFEAGKKVLIQKFKMYQFFVNSRVEFKNYLKENSQMEVLIKKSGKTVGKTDLDIIDFMSPIVKYKSFYKILTSESGVLGYLNCKIAIEEEEYIDVTNIPLIHHSGIFVPPEDFLLCLPLPEEWFELLPKLENLPSKNSSRISLVKIPLKPRPQSERRKNDKKSLTRSNHLYRPRSCTAREKH